MADMDQCYRQLIVADSWSWDQFGEPPYPSAQLFWAIVATQIVAVAICLVGFGVRALAPAAIVAVWIYCLAWTVVLDMLKLAFLGIAAARERALARQRMSLAL